MQFHHVTFYTIFFFVLCKTVICQRNYDREVLIHFDMKGAPVRPAYFLELLTTVAELGASGVLIEWEDMFPFTGELEKARNGFAYSIEDVEDALQHAQGLGLKVMPLVQTVGHLEWILKLEEFSFMRDDPLIPMVACIADSRTQNVIFEMVDQVLAVHHKYGGAPFFHIGLDEVFQIGKCEANSDALKKFGNDSKKFVLDFARIVSSRIIENQPKTKVLMWFDEFKGASPELVKSLNLDKLITPMVWKYSSNLEKDLPFEMWQNLSHSFQTVWGASAFKGADGSNRYWNRVKPYVQNNKEWFLQSVKYSGLFSEFQGMVLTGWQRYDHFASLCELWPVSMASLAINIQIARNFIISHVESELILKVLKCPADANLNQLIAGDDKCRFPGYKLRDSIRDFIKIKTYYDNSSWIHNREFGWLQNSQMRVGASNPYYIDLIGKTYSKLLGQLDGNLENLKKYMLELYFSDVSEEWIIDYVQPLYSNLQRRLSAVQEIDTKTSYSPRPWFIKTSSSALSQT